MLSSAVMIVFPSLMAYAGSTDLLTMKIANWVSVALVAAFIGLAQISGMPFSDILEMHLVCGLAVLLLTFSLFAFGWIGGGDAKLAAATAVWVGWDNLASYGLIASLGGGVLTLLILAARRVDLPEILDRQPWIKRLHTNGNGVPYGIALAFAGLTLYPDTAIWSAVVGG